MLLEIIRHVAQSPEGLVVAGAWAGAEAISWPVMAEVVLFLLIPAAPGEWWRLGVACALGSVVGAGVNLLLGRRGVRAPWPLTTQRMHEEAGRGLLEEGERAVWHQALSGIPVKVYARLAGERGMGGRFLVHTAGARSVRILLVAGGSALLARGVAGELVHYGAYLVVMLTAFSLLFARVVRSWS